VPTAGVAALALFADPMKPNEESNSIVRSNFFIISPFFC
jgi:hypothetical protein